LRARYESAGATFRSKSDTEVVLHAYAEYGCGFVERLNGIYAYGQWDCRARRLVLGRDRFGVKPLYYRLEPDRLVFASEIKPILAVMRGSCAVSAEALNEYFTFQNVYSDLTLFEGIRILGAGHLLIAEGGRIERRRYWDLVFAPEEDSPHRLEAQLREAFEAAVDRQLVSDVPVGSYLSGGMDSASIVSVASRRIPRLATFSVGFDLSSVSGLELVFDERADAERLASRFSTEHYEMVLHEGDMAWALPNLVWHMEDLRAGNSYQNFYAARLASKFVRVVLSGTGGDEIFAGYPWRYTPVAECWDEAEFDERYYRAWCRLVPDRERANFFTAEVARQIDLTAPRESFRAILRATKGWHPLDRALYFDIKTFLHALLVVEDRLSMANGLEARVPLLDENLVEVAARIPARYKLAGGTGKVIFRRALADLLPAETLAKAKQGFSPPDQSWYRGPTMAYIRDMLLSPRAAERRYIEPRAVRRIIAEHEAGHVNHRLLLWSLLCFEWWCRLFLDGDTRALAGQSTR
jgi:asparagine synthase (glutamine-hydrolysing)